ncbi:MFS general substrate transporter [Hypoxylon sp. FL1150]|nr:MFS general substrate transporter [Hypoxylon sp. FL1150]
MPNSTLPNPLPLGKGTPDQEKEMSSSTTTTDDTVTPSPDDSHKPPPPAIVLPEDFRTLIKAADCGDELAMKWPTRTKWTALTVVFFVQLSMNLNTTLYSNGIDAISKEYNVTEYAVRWGGAASFLIAYAFGCELWAPWSEEYGRRWVLQLSLFLVNCWAILVALAPVWVAHVFGRTLGGLSSAGGSVTLALVSDMFTNDDPMFQHATSFIVLSSVGGSIIGPIIGGVIERYCAWQWCIWIQVIFGFFVQALHFFLVKETRATVIMDRVAKGRRESGQNPYLFGPNEMSEEKRITAAEVAQIWMRPFYMFLTEPIVLSLSLLSGFSDALIFMMVQCFTFVYYQWEFKSIQVGLTFLPIGLGYLIGAAIFYFFIKRNIRVRERNPASEHAQYESRLKPLLYLGLLLPIGLFMFAFTSAWSKIPIHWIYTMMASCMIGISNYAIYMATIDYVLRAYGPYSASATGGNGFARDFLAGILTPYAVPMYVLYSHLMSLELLYEKMSVFSASILLTCVATALYGAVILVYWRGPWLRRRSKFALNLAQAAETQDAVADADDNNAAARSAGDTTAATNNINHQLLFLPSQSLPGSRAVSSAGSTPATSARNSLHLTRPQILRQVSEPTHVRPRVAPRQVSALSVNPSPLHRQLTGPAAAAAAAAEESRNAGANNSSGSNRCTCVGKNIAGCNCGCKDGKNANAQEETREETQRSSVPTSVREVENAPSSSENAAARTHVHFLEGGEANADGNAVEEGAQVQERENFEDDHKRRCIVM